MPTTTTTLSDKRAYLANNSELRIHSKSLNLSYGFIISDPFSLSSKYVDKYYDQAQGKVLSRDDVLHDIGNAVGYMYEVMLATALQAEGLRWDGQLQAAHKNAVEFFDVYYNSTFNNHDISKLLQALQNAASAAAKQIMLRIRNDILKITKDNKIGTIRFTPASSPLGDLSLDFQQPSGSIYSVLIEAKATTGTSNWKPTYLTLSDTSLFGESSYYDFLHNKHPNEYWNYHLDKPTWDNLISTTAIERFLRSKYLDGSSPQVYQAWKDILLHKGTVPTPSRKFLTAAANITTSTNQQRIFLVDLDAIAQGFIDQNLAGEVRDNVAELLSEALSGAAGLALVGFESPNFRFKGYINTALLEAIGSRI